jgi:glutathione synthase/RimK-type ligase-like ATP-grasp enzyme
MSARQAARVLVSGSRAPVALGIGLAFEAAGEEVHFVDSVPSLMARWSSFGTARMHRVRPPKTSFDAFRGDMRALISGLDPHLIVPTCEEIFYLARAAELDGYEDRLFAPASALLRRLHSKADFAELALACGLQPPRTWKATSAEELRAFAPNSGELVFKPEFSRFGAETLVRPAAEKLARLSVSPEKAWVIQEFVAGEEVCVWSAAREGRLLAISGYRPRWHFGGASSYFQREEDPALTDICRTLAAATNMTGQLSLDLIRTADGVLRPIECNPRAVSGVQLFAGDARLARALAGQEPGLLTPLVDACHVGPAFWSAAAAHILTRRRFSDVLADARGSHDVLTRSGGARAAIGAVMDSARFALNGLRSSRSAVQESTADIEWNGGPIR